MVAELLALSTSSEIMRSLRAPVICPEIPRDLTDGACDALAGLTSKLTLDCLWSSLGFKCDKTSISLINLNVNVEKSSALFLDAETTNMFN